MVPKYNVSDVLLSKEIDVKDIQVGDDVVYIGKEGSFKNRVVTHQVISKTEQDGKYKFITKGIANTEEKRILKLMVTKFWAKSNINLRF